jgi:hypothetical protein
MRNCKFVFGRMHKKEGHAVAFLLMNDRAVSSLSTHGATRVMPTMSKMVLKFSDRPAMQTVFLVVLASVSSRVSSDAGPVDGRIIIEIDDDAGGA